MIKLRGSFALVVALGLSACAVEAPAEQVAAVDESALVARVLADVAEVHADRLVFPKSVFPRELRSRIDASETVFLSGDRQSDAVDRSGRLREDVGNPYGYLRRVVSYHDEGGKTVVMTAPASLDEAFEDFNEERIIPIQSGDSTRPGQAQPRFGADKKFHFNVPVIDIKNRELYSGNGLDVRLQRGFVTLDTTIDLGADVGFFKLNDAHVIVDAALDSGLTVEATADGSFEKDFDVEVFHARWPVGAIGPVPVTLGLSAKVGCEVKANGHAHATAGVELGVTVRGGVEYKRNEGVKPVFKAPQFSPRVVPPQVEVDATSTTRCFLRPQLEVLLYDVAGPALTPELSAKLNASGPPLKASVDGAFAVDVGGQLRIFGKDLGSFHHRVFEAEKKDLWKLQ